MTIQLVPNAVGMSEFGSYNGDCMWASLLVCLHTADPATWPATLPVLDGIVSRAVSAGDTTGAAGQATMAGVLAFVRADADMALQLAQVREYDPAGWAMEGAGGWHEYLSSIAGQGAILLQIANGGAFGVQPGLQGHAIAVLGHDTDTQEYLCADPDNPACFGGALVRYSLATLAAAEPIAAAAFNVQDVTPPPPPPPPTTDADDPILAAAQAQVLALTAQVAMLTGQLATLQAQYDQLKAEAGPGAVEAVQLVAAIAKALAALPK